MQRWELETYFRIQAVQYNSKHTDIFSCYLSHRLESKFAFVLSLFVLQFVLDMSVDIEVSDHLSSDRDGISIGPH